MESGSQAFEHPDLVEFFEHHRNTPEDLYPSERRFLVPLAERAESVLDVGCAAGGFASIWRAFKPAIRYTGVDVGEALIEAARVAHPDCEFLVGNAAEGLPLPDRAAAAVAALGWLHWEPRYAQAMRELWRLTDRNLFFDIRLQDESEQDLQGNQRIAYLHDWDGVSTTPYIAAAWRPLAQLLVDLGPAAISGHGYWGEPAETVAGLSKQVCFATFVLTRDEARAGARPEISLDLPLEWPSSLEDSVRVVQPDRMEELL